MGMEKFGLRRGLSVGVAAACAAGAGAVTMGASPTRVEAAAVSCGATITVSTTLTSDVGPCPETPTSLTTTATTEAAVVAGIKIGADNITLDLNGHHVIGCNPVVSSTEVALLVSNGCTTPQVVPALNTTSPTSSDASAGGAVTGSGVGILVVNHTGVTIKDGTTTSTSFGKGSVENFDAGIEFSGGSGNTVSGIAVRNNVASIPSACCWGEGIGMWNSSSNTISDNRVTGNGPYGGIAVYGYSQLQPTGPTTSTLNVIGKSTGISPLGGGNSVGNNAPLPNGFSYQDDGVRVEPGVTYTTVENNRVSGSSLDGIAIFGTATHSTVKNNQLRGNGFGTLQLVQAGGATQRMGDGIRVFYSAEDGSVSGNTACGNAGNGIRVDAENTTVTSNTSGNGSNCIKNDQGVDPKPSGPTVTPVPPSVTTNVLAHDYADLYDGTAVAANTVATKCGVGATANDWTGNTAGPNKYAAVSPPTTLNDSYNNPCTVKP